MLIVYLVALFGVGYGFYQHKKRAEIELLVKKVENLLDQWETCPNHSSHEAIPIATKLLPELTKARRILISEGINTSYIDGLICECTLAIS